MTASGSVMTQFPYMYIYNILSTPLPLLIMKIVLCMAVCNDAEYKINGECCPLCNSGMRVKSHCNVTTSTICEPCRNMTYTDASNGLMKCLSCSLCDTHYGLRVKHTCTSKSNTVCGPLPGYYCRDVIKLTNCKTARKHSTCLPGQYINQTGTESSDTVCESCPEGSYSDGTFCKLHTICESLGKATVNAGSMTSDAQCSRPNGAPDLRIVISSVSVVVVLLCIIVIIVVFQIKKKYKQYDVQ